MVQLGFTNEAYDQIHNLLTIIQTDDSPVRKSDALNYLLGAVTKCTDNIFWEIYNLFYETCTTRMLSSKKNSKGQSSLAHWAGYVTKRDPERGKQLVEAIEGPIHKQQALQSIEF